jgi:hypothetical protein
MPLSLRPDRGRDRNPGALRRIAAIGQRRVPFLDGPPVCVRFLPALRAHRGKLHSDLRGSPAAGSPVHAGTFIRRRLIVLDSGLLRRPNDLTRILVHELFHFVWVRLGNSNRDAFAGLLKSELSRGAKGELGWSAESRKINLERNPPRKWREYVCESFCDTGAWVYAGVHRHGEFTLAARYRKIREKWCRQVFGGRLVPI